MEAKRIMADGLFERCLQENIEKFTKRGMPPAGQVWKRSSLDSLQEKGLLDTKSLKAEFNRIIDKKSTLSRAERDMVRDICWDALKRASLKMQVEEQNRKAAESEKSPVSDSNGTGGTTARKKKKNAPDAKSDANNVK